MSYANRIIEKFGGVRPMSRTTGIPPSTLQSWKKTGFIPARRQPAVLEFARREGVDLDAHDFFAQPKAVA